MTEKSVKPLKQHVNISLLTCDREKYKDICHKGTGSQRHKTFTSKSHNSWHNDFSACAPFLLQDLAPIF